MVHIGKRDDLIKAKHVPALVLQEVVALCKAGVHGISIKGAAVDLLAIGILTRPQVANDHGALPDTKIFKRSPQHCCCLSEVKRVAQKAEWKSLPFLTQGLIDPCSCDIKIAGQDNTIWTSVDSPALICEVDQ